MTRVRATVFFFLVFLLALSINVAAQDESITILGDSGTTSQSALLASFVASIDDGAAASTGISISNILGAPSGSGFPGGADESGPIWIYLFNSIGTVYVFHTDEFPDVGSGLDVDGSLAPGGTYTVNLREILIALHPDREPADRDFAGYAWVVANFDAATGTYFNFFPLVGASQAFQMEPAVGGIPVEVESGQ